jgi:hypothetical protein
MDTSGRVEHDTTQKPDVPLMPGRKPLRTWAGHGTGAQCSGCGETIEPHEIEYEIELPADGGEQVFRFQPGGTGKSLHLHFACYKTWIKR